ncbi:MAG TPA: N-acetyl-gamma-glutamyl-phosphate reductase [Planctomycetota bacterium]|nr:N-acetyl-gamma-glutamyl-phosphate reductase [Planctomycetota bacterium]
MSDPTPLWIYGAGGMLAGELMRLIEQHPALALRVASSRKEASLAQSQPHLASGGATVDAARADASLVDAVRSGERAAVALALPHGESIAAWSRIRAALADAADHVALVDLAADFRLRDPKRYAAAYGQPHPAPDELGGFAYGLPELRRDEIRSARRAAAPGCFATALQLAVVPAAKAGLLDPNHPWVIHGVTGSSGSGNEPKPGTHHPHRHGNFWAYGLEGHRHEAELAQALEALKLAPEIHFLPHSGPFARGIHLTTALPLARTASAAAAREVYAQAYRDEPFVEVLADGVPDLRRVAGSNRASIAVAVRGRVLVVLLALDNLVKGGAGQALQCLNILLDYPETWGLPRAGLGAC